MIQPKTVFDDETCRFGAPAAAKIEVPTISCRAILNVPHDTKIEWPTRGGFSARRGTHGHVDRRSGPPGLPGVLPDLSELPRGDPRAEIWGKI